MSKNHIPIEIERKFLVKSDAYKSEATKSYRIAQGYLSKVKKRTVRIRIKGDKGYITIKGKSSTSGLSRFEWEKEIPLNEAMQLLTLCESGIIDKTRYEIPFDGHIFEVDEFHGENSGLIIAEIELKSENEYFTKPDWISEEVTNKKEYYNSQLSKKPFGTWK